MRVGNGGDAHEKTSPSRTSGPGARIPPSRCHPEIAHADDSMELVQPHNGRHRSGPPAHIFRVEASSGSVPVSHLPGSLVPTVTNPSRSSTPLAYCSRRRSVNGGKNRSRSDVSYRWLKWSWHRALISPAPDRMMPAWQGNGCSRRGGRRNDWASRSARSTALQAVGRLVPTAHLQSGQRRFSSRDMDALLRGPVARNAAVSTLGFPPRSRPRRATCSRRRIAWWRRQRIVVMRLRLRWPSGRLA